MFECLAIEIFHGDERAALVITDFIDGANVRMIERGRGAGFTAEPFQRLRLAGHFFGKEFERDEPSELSVLGFVHHTHAAATQLFDDVVVRDSLANHGRSKLWAAMLGAERQGVNQRYAVGWS